LQSPQTQSSICIFSLTDWKEAYGRQIYKNNQEHNRKKRSKIGCVSTAEALPLKCVFATMEDVYHGSVPPADQRLFERWLRPPSQEATITLTAFLTAVHGACTEAETMIASRRFDAGPSCESRSWQEYFSNLRKCKASVRAPSQKQTMPLTAQQQIGWETPAFVAVSERKAIRSSEETKYASEMIKAGHFLF